MMKRRLNRNEYLRVAKQILDTKPSDMYHMDKPRPCINSENANNEKVSRESLGCSNKK